MLLAGAKPRFDVSFVTKFLKNYDLAKITPYEKADQDFQDLPEFLQTTSLPTRSRKKCQSTGMDTTEEQFCGGYTAREYGSDQPCGREEMLDFVYSKL